MATHCAQMCAEGKLLKPQLFRRALKCIEEHRLTMAQSCNSVGKVQMPCLDLLLEACLTSPETWYFCYIQHRRAFSPLLCPVLDAALHTSMGQLKREQRKWRLIRYLQNLTGKDGLKTEGIRQKNDHGNCPNTISAAAKNKGSSPWTEEITVQWAAKGIR